MRFHWFILKNIIRRRFRSTFTIVGVAVAVGAVVALVSFSTGFASSFAQMYEGRNIDLVVTKAGVTERITSAIDERLEETLKGMPDVRDVAPEMLDVVSFPDFDLIGVLALGWRPEAMQFKNLTLLDGKRLDSAGLQVMLGTVLAKNLGKKVGDKLVLYDSGSFEVVGVYRSFAMQENNGLIVPLVQLQRLLDRKKQVTLFDIMTKNPSDKQATDALIKRIESLGKGLSAQTTAAYVQGNTQIRASRAMAWVISTIALVIGAVGVLNTMVMSVAERTQEIGILRAIGWRRVRVVRMILAESLALSMIGALVGTAGALLLNRLLASLPSTSGLITGQIMPGVIVQGFIVALVVGLLGGIFPALHGARLLPTEALRHE